MTALPPRPPHLLSELPTEPAALDGVPAPAAPSAAPTPAIPITKVTGFRRLWVATDYSLRGLRAALRHEPAFRQEGSVLLLLSPVAIAFGRSFWESALLVGVLLAVLVVELLNSAVEAVVDLASPRYAELAGRAKDLGSAAVFLCVSFAAIVWLVCIWQWMPWSR